jgi:deoxyadenosine/deoxycytidine kinase
LNPTRPTLGFQFHNYQISQLLNFCGQRSQFSRDCPLLTIRAIVPRCEARYPAISGKASEPMANLFEAPRYIAVEGPVRVGKSTLARILADQLNAQRVMEPEGNPFLRSFYEGEPGAAFQAQFTFLVNRFQMLRGLDVGPNSQRTIVADFIFEKDKLFACLNLNDQELEIYNRYYNYFHEQVPTPDLVIYLQATPDVLKKRLRKKNAAGERGVSDEYLEEVVKAYEHFFFHYTSSDLLIVNTSEIDFVDHNEDLQELLRKVSEPIKGTQYFLPLGGQEAVGA